VRAAGDPMALAQSVRDAVRAADPDLPVTDVTTQTAQAGMSIAKERMLADLLGFFGVVALLLAAVGLYGVMAYTVVRRTNEMGIRMALGARRANILRLVVGQGLRATAIGLVIGALAALALQRVVESQLFGVTAADPLTFAVVAATLLAAALGATL